MTGKSTDSELVCQRDVLSASCLVSELTVSELVCQRDVCEVLQCCYVIIRLYMCSYVITC